MRSWWCVFIVSSGMMKREGSYIAEVRDILGVPIGDDVRLVALAGLETRRLSAWKVLPTSSRTFVISQWSVFITCANQHIER